MSSRLAQIAAPLVTALALILAGCANQPAPGQNPTPGRAVPLEAPEGAESEPAGDPAAGSGVIVQDETGATVEIQSTAQRERDAEDCYAYASASVARDRQVKDDRAAIFDESSTNRDVYAFTDRLDEYGNEQRRDQLFTNCMAAKGYSGGR